ncbi:uncharacterized protein PV09_03562 [Verruconis gallopava]|uniref:JmjC domain-containing histone demethylation protein 1 n=1 Tax=Verruconis gallopava TaxID=253628 RepID=A0A0D1YYB9_9PEZI|nr:uncharacterized protein PV09_03562 [Verruconis gallopava]KIW05702.1 hypothetical protein PV09_03562 [Verruconis gallopava]
MAYTTFKRDFKAPPLPRSRTPERITSAIEPIPEAALAIAELLKRDTSNRRTAARTTQKVRENKRSTKTTTARVHRHTHSNSASFVVPPASPIDTLASVAAFEATSRSPPTTFHNLYQSQYPLERSSKRARSEIAPSPQQPATSPLFNSSSTHRPATSYNYNGWSYNVEQGINNGQRMRSYSSHARTGSVNGFATYQESNVDEAELLLNFSRGGSISSSHGLGIVAPTVEKQTAQRTPALPPFPVATSVEPAKGLTESSSTQTQAMPSSPTLQAPPHSPISPPSNLIPPLGPSKEATELPMPDDGGRLGTSLTSLTTVADSKGGVPGDDDIKLDGQEETKPLARDDKEDVAINHSLAVLSTSEQQTKSNDALSISDHGGRRYSDSHQDHPSKRVRLDPGGRSSSAPLEYAISESTDHSTALDGQINVDDVSKLPEQGVVCPSCNNARDFGSEKVDWLQCDGCDQWYHVACSGLTTKQSKAIDKYYCPTCEPKFGKSTKKRTSSRVRAAVDYAGLNEGVLRTPSGSREHHYIESFKNGTVKLTPETFPRIPGNFITADYFEKCPSFSEPVVITKSLNPRPPFPGTTPREEMMEDDDRVLVPDDGQDDMDMVIPQGLTVRRVSELYGPKNQIPVIDVKAQESSKGWTVEKWADYYENPGDEPIRNVISLECSTTPLCRLIRRPKVVRDLDLQDSVWPDTELRRSVGFYVLMSVADCFTDFHIDFGGSSVYYHILKGKKVFFFIPPTPSNLAKYQEWNDMPSQTWTWLPDITKTKECYRVDLYPGDTMLIPAGWIHAVWTPDDSLVIGGNFLTRLHYGMQFRVAEIEKANKTPITFRYPKFQKVMWYAVLQYLERDPLPTIVRETFLDGRQFHRERKIWTEFDRFGENSHPGPENYNARYYSQAEIDGLPDMVNYIFRTVMIHMDRLENISAKVRKAVTDSIPKTSRDPLDIARDFAMWVAWKRGDEDIPEWAHPGAVLPNKGEDASDKKLTDAQLKKLQRASAIVVPERQSARLKSVAETAMAQQESLAAATSTTPKTSSLGPRRTACDSCRKRKMRCKHVENAPAQSTPIIFTNPMESSPKSNFVGVVLPDSSSSAQLPAASFPPPFQVDPVPPMANGFINDGFMPGPKQEILELKKGRTKACYDCRRSKRRCIHDEFGKIDPIKQREPVIPRGSAKRKSGPSPEMPLAKKPANDQIAPTAPMLAGQLNTFEVSPSASTSHVYASAKQDGMFRNSTVNDFSSMTGIVNVNPLASRNAGRDRTTSNAAQQSPSRVQPIEWAVDPALMDSSVGTAPSQQQEDYGYADAQVALMAYYQSNGGPPPSSHEAANQFMNGFVDYEAGQQPKMEVDIDPLLQDSLAAVQAYNRGAQPPNSETDLPKEGVRAEKVDHSQPRLGNGDANSQDNVAAQPASDLVLDPALDNAPQSHQRQASSVVLPSTEKSSSKLQAFGEAKAAESPEDPPSRERRKSSTAPRTPLVNGSKGKSTSPEAQRATPGKAPGRRKESSAALEETDSETKKLIEQMRQENLQSKGLRRRS